MRLEGWGAQVSWRGVSTDWVDHSWVCSPGNHRSFECWGGHDGPKKRRIVGGEGSYARADCYRCPVWPFPDTAGIGIFAVDGICHQSTNCFLYTANRTLTFDVRGYWFSLFSYGTYGRSYRRWLVRPVRPVLPDHALGQRRRRPARGGGRQDAGAGKQRMLTIRLVRAVYAPVRVVAAEAPP